MSDAAEPEQTAGLSTDQATDDSGSQDSRYPVDEVEEPDPGAANRSNRSLWIGIACLVVLLVIAAVVYFQRANEGNQAAGQSAEQTVVLAGDEVIGTY